MRVHGSCWILVLTFPVMALIGKLNVDTRSRVKALEKSAEKNGFRYNVYSPNGDHYMGEWQDNLRHGDGVQVWKRSGLMYEGEWRRGVREGYGMLYRYQESTKEYLGVYLGTWRNNKMEGFGVYFYSANEKYEGEWVESVRSGRGRMVYENGDVYEGDWSRDQPDGQGVLVLGNGNRYEGCMKDGKKHGQGRFIYRHKGQVYEGTWVDGAAKCGTLSAYGEENPEHTHTHTHAHTHTPPEHRGSVRRFFSRPRFANELN